MSYIFESPTDESKALSVLDRPFGPIDPPFEMNHFLVFLFFFTISTIPISGVSFRSRPVQEATLLNSAVDVSTDTRTIASTSASTSSASTSSASFTSVIPVYPPPIFLLTLQRRLCTSEPNQLNDGSF